MNKIRKIISKRNLEISEELIFALENAHLPQDVLELIFNILTAMQEAKRKVLPSHEIILDVETDVTPQEILASTYNRLDRSIVRSKKMKASVDSINLELQKLAYFD